MALHQERDYDNRSCLIGFGLCLLCGIVVLTAIYVAFT